MPRQHSHRRFAAAARWKRARLPRCGIVERRTLDLNGARAAHVQSDDERKEAQQAEKELQHRAGGHVAWFVFNRFARHFARDARRALDE